MTNKDILLTGGSGSLGTSILEVFHENNESNSIVLAPSSSELDVTNLDSIKAYLASAGQSVVSIIHAAATTDWEKADSDPDQAFRVNALGTMNMAKASLEHGAKFVYISTDAVFPGLNKDGGYTENDTPLNPVSIYGITKLAGEYIAASIIPNLIIARLGWLFGPNPSKDIKFVGKILGQLANGTHDILAVSDKVGSPTYTLDAATRILELTSSDFRGVIHIVNAGIASRHEVAEEVNSTWKTNANVSPVPSSRFPSPVRRPDFSGLSTVYKPLRPWKDALIDYRSKYPLSRFKKDEN